MKNDRSPRGHWLFLLLSATLVFLTLNPSAATAQSSSQVRIVRLSFVEGTVTMYRPDADQWANAFVNTPIQQGFKLATDANSFAEVEFENGSTARLGQSSELDFTSLELSADGGKVNHLTLARGYATFAVTPEKGDVYQVLAGGSTYDAASNAMFRIDSDESGQQMKVFKGDVSVQGPQGSATVAANHVLEVAPGAANTFQVTEGVTEDAWDQWVNKRQETATVASNKAAPAEGTLSAGNSLYGWNDLSYFGAWNYLPGVGNCWSPSMGGGWSPYSIGRWSWYPGFGYTWISGEPWGWLPFHYGSWIYPAATGWCWLPGNFSSWSPALVTWYEGPGWVSWTPRTYTGPSSMPVNCPRGQICSVAVSSNTFQGGRPISPRDVVRDHSANGRLVESPTVPLTRSLRLPGSPVEHSRALSATATQSGAAGLRVRRTGAAPVRVFSQSTVRGAWNVQPHAPAVFNQQTRRFVNSAGPAINNDMLIRGRSSSSPLNRSRGLTPIPISQLGAHGGAMRHSNSILPSAEPVGNAASVPAFHQRPMPDLRQERMLQREQRMENARARRRMEELNRLSNRSQQSINRPSSAGRNSGDMRSQGQSVSRPSGQMGGGMRPSGMGGASRSSGMGGGNPGGTGAGGGGGMRSSGGGPHRR